MRCATTIPSWRERERETREQFHRDRRKIAAGPKGVAIEDRTQGEGLASKRYVTFSRAIQGSEVLESRRGKRVTKATQSVGCARHKSNRTNTLERIGGETIRFHITTLYSCMRTRACERIGTRRNVVETAKAGYVLRLWWPARTVHDCHLYCFLGQI